MKKLLVLAFSVVGISLIFTLSFLGSFIQAAEPAKITPITIEELTQANFALRKAEYDLANIYFPPMSSEMEVNAQEEKRQKTFNEKFKIYLELKKLITPEQKNKEYEPTQLQQEFHQWKTKFDLRNMRISLPELSAITLKNNLKWHLQNGYWYLDDFFQGKLKEPSNVFPCLNLEDYKIHLMPKKEDLQSTIWKLLKQTEHDPELINLIADFKFIKKFEKFDKNEDYNMAIIVIYATSGKTNAQRLLNKIYSLFKDQDGLNIKPRWNEKVTSLIYFAQGHGDQKITSRYSKFFEPGNYKGNGKIYFKPDVTGTYKDYHLINPAIEAEKHPK